MHAKGNFSVKFFWQHYIEHTFHTDNSHSNKMAGGKYYRNEGVILDTAQFNQSMEHYSVNMHNFLLGIFNFH